MKASYLIIGLFALACVATGCDNISEDERYIKVEKPVIDNPRNLLIMEFTGNNCINCPEGAETILKIKEGEALGRVISVGLHPYGSQFTKPIFSIHHPPTYYQDLRSEAATAMYDYYDPSAGFPSAVFNGLKSSMTSVIGNWDTKASEALEMNTGVNLSATCDYEPESRNLTVNYKVEFLDDMAAKLNVTVWLLENNIIGSQEMPNNVTDYNYRHNHVLRASLNGNWGQELAGYPFQEGDIKEGSAAMTINEEWVAENCDVVVYVYREDNKEVEQAISFSIIED